MFKKITTYLVIFSFLFSYQVRAEEKLWTEGSEKPQARVNVDLKSLSPKAYVNVSEKVDESVVNISTTQTIRGYQSPFGFQMDPNGQGDQGGQEQNPFGQFFGPDLFRQFFGNAQPKPQKQSSLGSGFVISRDGYVVTNNHVVAQADEITVTFYDESDSKAKIIGRDAKTDVALLKVERIPEKLNPVIFGDSDSMKVGDIVVAIGNPFGLSHSLTQGIISAKERAIGLGPYDDFFQTDASINPGNSGGPLLNLYGEVIGINTAIHAGGQGIGFAIPINSAKDVLVKLHKDGKITRAQIGVKIQMLTDDHVKALKLKSKDGALVAEVMEGSPAEKAGVKPGDVIVAFDGKKVKDTRQLPILVGNTEVGKSVKLEVIRNSSPKTLTVTLVEQQDEKTEEDGSQSPTPSKEDVLGLNVQTLTKEIGQSLGLSEKQKGVVVTNVNPDSLAYSKGVRKGDVIVEVNRQNVASAQEYTNIVKPLKKGNSVLLLIVRKQGTLFLAFEL